MFDLPPMTVRVTEHQLIARHCACGTTPVSEGTSAAMARRAADGLSDFLTQVGDRVAASEVAGFDETCLRVAGSLRAGVLGRFRGVAVHDARTPYDTYVEAIATGVDAVAPDTLAEQVQLYRSATQIGMTQTAARSGKLMKKHNAPARRLLDQQDHLPPLRPRLANTT